MYALYMLTCVYTYPWIHVHVYIHVRTCVYPWIHVHVYIHVRTCVCIWVSVYVCYVFVSITCYQEYNIIIEREGEYPILQYTPV